MVSTRTNRWTPCKAIPRGAFTAPSSRPECRQPGVSVAAVALAHGLNANLVRKWLDGRGLKRSGLVGPGVRSIPPGDAGPACFAALQFLPVEPTPASAAAPPGGAIEPPAAVAAIHVELRRAGTALSVHWPASQAQTCAAWLRDLTAALAQ